MARRSLKRKRYAKTKRSKNKYVKTILITDATATNKQINTILYSATYPCTIAGLRWNFACSQGNMTFNTGINFFWIIYVIEEGDQPKNLTIGTVNNAEANDGFKGEQNVIAWGKGQCTQNYNATFDSATKSMRKLQGGDVLAFSIKYEIITGNNSGTDTPGVTCTGGVQFFTLV